MKKSISLAACLLMGILLSPFTALALDNNMEVSIETGSGDSSFPVMNTTGDTEYLRLGLNYTHYFKTLERDDSPYGAREFLQHPSYIEAGFMTYDFDGEYSTGDRTESSADLLLIEGKYFTPGGDMATGIGLMYGSSDTESVYVVSGWPTPIITKSDSETISLGLTQYLAKNVKLDINYYMQDAMSDNVYHDEDGLNFRASALIDRIWVSAYITDGEDEWPAGNPQSHEFSGSGITVGVYPSRTIGLGISYDTTEYDYGSSESEITYLSFTGDVYLNESIHLNGAITLYEADFQQNGENEETRLELGAGLYF